MSTHAVGDSVPLLSVASRGTGSKVYITLVTE